jgi:hypothetical protein
MEIQIKDMKRGDVVYDLTDSYKAYSDAEFVDGLWQCDTTSSGEYAVILREDRDPELFDNRNLE